MTNARIWLIANWKMNGTAATTADFAAQISTTLTEAPKTIDAVFCPPTLYIADVRAALPKGSRLNLGAQNFHDNAKGA